MKFVSDKGDPTKACSRWPSSCSHRGYWLFKELKAMGGYEPVFRIGWAVAAAVILYVAVCFGKIAAKHGKNPFLYGVLSVISPVNLIILGYWAFSDVDTHAGGKKTRG